MLTTTLLGGVAMFAAAPAANADQGQNPHYELGDAGKHYMGSQVAKHEERGPDPGARMGKAAATVKGNDVSHYQGSINWKSVYSKGARFSYIKATEGASYRDPNFSANYTGSYKAGFIRGAYHFARPDGASGAKQAKYFAKHGGGWSKDGKTLPGALDIEYAPSGDGCYGKSKSAMRSWLSDFINTYHSQTGRWATIYTTTSWWKQCTGNSGAFAKNSPLWVARWSSGPGELPKGWGFHTIWQYNDHGTFPGDQNSFNGSYSRLKALANG